MKRQALILIFCFTNLLCSADKYSIYVSNQTGWKDFYLYAWGDKEFYGGWPGVNTVPTATIDGNAYYIYEYTVPNGVQSMVMNLIFHNNVGESQPGDRRQLIDLKEVRDYYLIVSATGIREVSPIQPPGNTSEQLLVDNSTAISDENRVIYELNLYAFTPEGTLSAAERHLPELRQLGVDIIWLMPIFPRGIQGRIGSLGSPYAVKDYKAVNSDHGSLQDLKNFVMAAHQLGMKVWLDWVPNHTALDHPWAKSHPHYYHRVNGVIQNANNYPDVYQLKFDNAELRQEMIRAMLYWVDEADIDGYRCDYIASPWLKQVFWQELMPALQSNSRGKRVEMLGEADFSDPNIHRFLFNVGFDYDYAWGFADAIKSVGQSTSAQNAKSAGQSLLNTVAAQYDNMSRMAYLTNHDDIGNNFTGNYMTVLGSNVAPMTVMYFTFFGMPLIYNGQEIGSTKILNYFEHDCIDWNRINHQLKNTLRTLVYLKHTQPALADGKAADRAETRWINTNHSSVLAYEKSKDGNTVLVVLNLSDYAVDVTLSNVTADDYTKVLDSQTIAAGCYYSQLQLTNKPTLRLQAKGYHVYTNKTDLQTNVSCLPVQQVTACKIMRDGQLLITCNGHTYTILGIPIQ